MDFDSMSLGDLFAAADEIGCKYQSEGEIAFYRARAELAAIETEIAEAKLKLSIARQRVDAKAAEVLEKYPLL